MKGFCKALGLSAIILTSCSDEFSKGVVISESGSILTCDYPRYRLAMNSLDRSLTYRLDVNTTNGKYTINIEGPPAELDELATKIRSKDTVEFYVYNNEYLFHKKRFDKNNEGTLDIKEIKVLK
ncbi:MAG TPA: hypothetical protein VEC16_05465 [Alphaproteobacteria bacterium]|nr:hypothetical protein [Alphaproteobacteria bacterium]